MKKKDYYSVITSYLYNTQWNYERRYIYPTIMSEHVGTNALSIEEIFREREEENKSINSNNSCHIDAEEINKGVSSPKLGLKRNNDKCIKKQ